MRPIPFNYAVSKILNSGRKFNPNGLLRFALLGLFDDKKKNTMVDMDAIFEFKTFIENRQTGLLGIYFNFVRLGAFYPNGRPCDGDSDGTIVALAANDQESKKI